MYNTNAQGKTGKAGATQETITAQNSANQGNEYFNGISQEELEGVCEILSKLWSKPGSLQFRPNYFENYMKMADGFVRSARTSADKKNMVLNAIGFLCAALLDTGKEYEKWEHIAQRYYPDDLDDITVGEDGEFADKEELTQAVCYEIECILADWDTSVSAYDPEDWPEAEELINEYIDVLDDHDCEVPEWVFQGRDERYEWYNA